jgi:poly-gamma-glutamate synthesis protein (capsule biosynthesis protein)
VGQWRVRRPLVLALLVLLLSASGPGVLAPTPSGSAAAAPPLTAVGPYRQTARAEPVFRTETVTAARLGSSHRRGCPVAVADLRLVTVTHLRFDGTTARGQLVVHRDAAAAVVRVFRSLLAARFPLASVRTVEAYGSDDARSMAANNTSAYNCRRTTGGTGWSEHAYGRAIDLNPVQNPYVRGTTVLPAAGRAYADRARPRAGMVLAGDPVVRAFAAVGWRWGGSFTSLKDYQHFSASGR